MTTYTCKELQELAEENQRLKIMNLELLHRSHETGGRTAQAEQMRNVGDQVERMVAELGTLRMADDLNQQGAEHMRDEVAKLKKELLDEDAHSGNLEIELALVRQKLTALKEAARPVVADWEKNHGFAVVAETGEEVGYVVATFAQLDNLARLCGEE